MTLKRKRGVSCFKLTIYLSARERSEEFPTQRGSSFEELASQPTLYTSLRERTRVLHQVTLANLDAHKNIIILEHFTADERLEIIIILYIYNT